MVGRLVCRREHDRRVAEFLAEGGHLVGETRVCQMVREPHRAVLSLTGG